MSGFTLQKSQPHPRRIIRNQVKLILKENTDLAGRWFCSRPNPLYVNELPCGLIYFPEEEADARNTRPISYRRKLLLTTEVQQREESTIENDLDDYLDSRAFEIEVAMMQDKFLYLGEKQFIEKVCLVRTQCVQIDYSGDSNIASIRLFWEITYNTDSWLPAELDEFLRFNSEYIAQIGDGARAEDHVIIREE